MKKFVNVGVVATIIASLFYFGLVRDSGSSQVTRPDPFSSIDSYVEPFERMYTISSDFTMPVASITDFGFQSILSGTGTLTVSSGAAALNSGYTIGSGATSGGYSTFSLQKNDTGTRLLALSTTPARLKWYAAATGTDLVQRMELMGFGSSVVNGVGYASGGASSCVCFRIDVTVANTALIAVTKNAAVETTTTTSTTEVLDTFHTFEIIATSTSAQFLIDNVVVATHVANIPTATLVPLWSVRNKENVGKQLNIDWVKFTGPRS